MCSIWIRQYDPKQILTPTPLQLKSHDADRTKWPPMRHNQIAAPPLPTTWLSTEAKSAPRRPILCAVDASSGPSIPGFCEAERPIDRNSQRRKCRSRRRIDMLRSRRLLRQHVFRDRGAIWGTWRRPSPNPGALCLSENAALLSAMLALIPADPTPATRRHIRRHGGSNIGDLAPCGQKALPNVIIVPLPKSSTCWLTSALLWSNSAKRWSTPGQCWPNSGEIGSKLIEIGRFGNKFGRVQVNVGRLRTRSDSGQALSIIGQVWSFLGKCWSESGGTGPNLADSGQTSVHAELMSARRRSKAAPS